MTGSYNPLLAALSFVIASLASYAALDLAGRVAQGKGVARTAWLIGGAIVMGIGIWSMHFVGMLAFHLPVPIGYSLPLMLYSVAVAIGASLLALLVVSRPTLSHVTLVAAGAIMGLAIAGMHYIGMASMYMQATLDHNNGIVVLSILVAIGASTVALWLAVKFRSETMSSSHMLKGASALVMGLAIAGMHYTAMSGARFTRAASLESPATQVLATTQLAAAVAIGTIVMIVLALIGGVIDRTLKSRAQVNARLQKQAADLEEVNRELKKAVCAAEESRAAAERSAEALRTTEERLQQARRMEEIGNLAGGIAHDFNNLLTAMRLNTELIFSESVQERTAAMDELRRCVDRAAALTQQLLAYGRRQVLNPTNLNLNTVVKRVDTMLRRMISEDIEIELDLDPYLAVTHVDQGQMEQVLTNLMLNASHAMPDGGKLVIRTRNITNRQTSGTNERSDAVLLTVEDNGQGMTPEVRRRAFEPFFTTRQQGEGSGLGLSMVYGIVSQSGGDVAIESVESLGTVVRIVLPQAEGQETRQPDFEPQYEARGGNEIILLVEDQDPVREAARRLLTKKGYSVLEATNGADAISKYGDNIDSFDLILTDIVMPQMGGRDLVAWIRVKRPDCPAIYMSGYSADREQLKNDADVPFLPKPFSATELSAVVRETLNKRTVKSVTRGGLSLDVA